MTLIRPITVRALPKYRIYLQFSDGAQGEVDLSGLVGKGVFKAWNNLDFFGQVHLAPHRAIQWSAEIELCPDALYMKLTGKTSEELFAKLRRNQP
jgi:uncharacterized protein DUF2442